MFKSFRRLRLPSQIQIAGLLALAVCLGGAGFLTNGLVLVQPQVLNGVTTPAPGGAYTQLLSSGLIPVDTGTAGGSPPQSVAATVFQVAVRALEAQANVATSTVHAATLNTQAGLITTEAVTTAVGAQYTFTLTNSLITAGSTPTIVVMPGTDTVLGFTQTSVTTTAGVATIVVTNTGTAALNGTLLIAFHL